MSWSIIERLRRRLALETGAVVKDWGGRITVALAFPHTYHAGMSNLGFQAIYGLLNARPDVACERVFLPDRDTAAEYARTNTPLLSLETQRPVAEFELLAFSLSHEGDYPNLVRLLDLARIPARREDRRETDPLVLAGGITMRTNPEPLALFLDLVLMGDGEMIVRPLLEAWREARSIPLPRKDRASRLAETIPGAYAPGLEEPPGPQAGPFVPSRTVKPARADQLPRPALASAVLTPDTEFASTRLVEIGRGCGRACRFCLASFVNRPPRIQPPDSIFEALGPPEPEGGRVGLVSPAVADHPQLEEIVRTLIDQGREVTVSSLRVENLTQSLAQALARGKLKGAAIAPEAGSDRLRCSINKGLTEDNILDAAELLGGAGLSRLKVYFMLGLPHETDDDLAALVDLVMKIQAKAARAAPGGRPEITVTLSPFIPKPATPFERRPMEDTRRLKEKITRLQRALNPQGGLRVHADPPKWAYLQTLFSRGDRRVGAVIEGLARGDGPGRALKRAGFDTDEYVHRDMTGDDRTPWSFIDHGFKTGYLAGESARAENGRATPACRPDVCRLCGVCGPENERSN